MDTDEKAGALQEGAGQQRIELQINNSTITDPKVVLAVFTDRFATKVRHEEGNWSDVVDGISKVPEVSKKDQCQMLKLARFGDQPTDKKSLRHDGNVLEVYGVEADYDGGEVTLQTAIEKLREYDILAVGYESWSNTPERPRWRVLVPFSRPRLPEERKRYVEVLNGMVGGILAPESDVLSQVYYFGIPVGEKRNCFSIDNAKRCIDELPDEQLQKLRHPFRPSHEKRHNRRDEPTQSRSQPNCENPKAKPLLHPATIASALSQLDPDMNRPGWLRIGMALHSTEAGEEAFDMWNIWSSKGTKYKEGECAALWGTFSNDHANKRPVTIKTLYGMASDAGWDGEISTASDVLPLVPLQSRRILTKFSNRYAIVMVKGQAVVAYRDFDQNMRRMTTQLSRTTDIELLHKPDKLPYVVTKKTSGEKEASTEIKYKPLVPAWLESRLRRTYSQMVFKPSADLIAGDTELPDGEVLNLYQGLAITPKQGECELILRHIYEVWCNGSETVLDYVLKWLARMFQKPGERGHTCIILRSGEGTGKNIIVDILVRAFGEHATVCVRHEHLVGRFNDDLGTSVFVFVNEAVWGGDKSLEGALKSLITDEELPVERKYMPKFRVKNCVHLLMASNNDWVAPIGLDDRRFVVLDMSEHRKGDFEYFKKLKNEIENGGQEAFIQYLLDLDISDFNPRQLPDLGTNQATKLEAKVRGADSITQWWWHCLEAGEIAGNGVAGKTLEELSLSEGYNLTPDWETGPTPPIIKEALYEAYVKWAGRRKHIEHISSFGRKFKSLANVKATRPVIGGKQRRCYVLPRLDECRARFEKQIKQPIDWTDGSESEAA